MEKEIQSLSGISAGTKKIQINDKEESISVNSQHIMEDLLVFKNSDINKPSWKGLYQVDSVFNESRELQTITYHALKPKLRNQKMRIDFKAGEVIKIEINNVTKAKIADAEQQLIYQPGIGYEVINSQQLLFFPKSMIQIETKFNKKYN